MATKWNVFLEFHYPKKQNMNDYHWMKHFLRISLFITLWLLQIKPHVWSICFKHWSSKTSWRNVSELLQSSTKSKVIQTTILKWYFHRILEGSLFIPCNSTYHHHNHKSVNHLLGKSLPVGARSFTACQCVNKPLFWDALVSSSSWLSYAILLGNLNVILALVLLHHLHNQLYL